MVKVKREYSKMMRTVFTFDEKDIVNMLHNWLRENDLRVMGTYIQPEYIFKDSGTGRTILELSYSSETIEKVEKDPKGARNG